MTMRYLDWVQKSGLRVSKFLAKTQRSKGAKSPFQSCFVTFAKNFVSFAVIFRKSKIINPISNLPVLARHQVIAHFIQYPCTDNRVNTIGGVFTA